MTLNSPTLPPGFRLAATRRGKTTERLRCLDSPTAPRDTKDQALAAERRGLENFARVSGGWFWETDTEHRFTYMSESVREVTGVAPEWHYGKTRSDLGMPAAVSQAEWDEHLRMLQDHAPFEAFIFQRPGPDGLKWMQTSGIPVFNEDGGFLGYQGIATDITAQVEAEREVRLLANAMEEFNESFVLWGADERLVICNKKFREINHAVPEFLTPGTLFSDHIRAVVEAGLANIADMTTEAWISYRQERFRNPGEPIEMSRQDGTTLWIVEQRMGDGSTVTTATDITLLKQAQQDAATTHRRLEDAMEVMPGGFVVFNSDDEITHTNSTYRKWFAPPGVDSLDGWTYESPSGRFTFSNRAF